MKNGIEIKPVPDIKKGFLIGEKNGNVRFDVTEDAISEILREYLNPKLKQILEKSKK